MSDETASLARLGTIDVPPEAMIARAATIAKPLADLILKRRLYTEIKDKKYVHVDGWTTLGACIGVVAREVFVAPIADGYEGTVELVSVRDGTIVGKASSICTRDEERWAKADNYAIRSMAVTRATGKAFRLSFGWIMKLAGYESTPAEEMPHNTVDVRPKDPVERPQQPI